MGCGIRIAKGRARQGSSQATTGDCDALIQKLKLLMAKPKPDLAGASRININGNSGWLLGANLPWINCGNDFGASGYGSYGIGSPNPPEPGTPLSSDVLRGAFQTMQAAGVNVARWFLFFDGRSGIPYDAA